MIKKRVKINCNISLYQKLMEQEMSKKNDQVLRCKLYQMDNSEEWQYLGIGYADIAQISDVIILFNYDQQVIKITFQEEQTNSIVHSHNVNSSYVYERQESTTYNIIYSQGNIICWYNLHDDEPEMALSFQNIKGTEIIWKILRRMNDIYNLELKIIDEKSENQYYEDPDTFNLFNPLQQSTENTLFIPNLNNLEYFEQEIINF